ncbi:MAG: TolC family protein [Bacteroidales bacterium]|nr:TolC family protein [Bacteroidales bacterium]
MKKQFWKAGAVMSAALLLFSPGLTAQQTLTLDECRAMAVENDKELKSARKQVEMAGYDRKIALANYFPEISITGAYLYNGKDISLISENGEAALLGAGTKLQAAYGEGMQKVMGALMSSPQMMQLLQSSPQMMQLLQELQGKDLATPVNAIAGEIDKSLNIDISNVVLGTATLMQPVFMGGKIIVSNQIAKLAEELARTRYEAGCQETVTAVDQTYWQIVSIAGKKKLAEEYAGLLHSMENDVRVLVAEGVATESDALSVKVKANEADMMMLKADNGLKLAKMLLCRQCGMDMYSNITLADERAEPSEPVLAAGKDMEQIFNDRSETRSLELAGKIYHKKIAVARADMMPQIALFGNYLISNPNIDHGIQKQFGGMFSAGVMVKVPIFHGTEALQKVRKAKAEAETYEYKLDNAKELITLQVSQLRQQLDEANCKLVMARSGLDAACENLRTAQLGFSEGVITANTVLQAQTAWLSANSSLIEAGVEMQIVNAKLQMAQGDVKADFNR